MTHTDTIKEGFLLDTYEFITNNGLNWFLTSEDYTEKGE